jgi:hypothetical protein
LSPIADITIAGQNPSFDRAFISEWMYKTGLSLQGIGYRAVDLHTLAYTYYKLNGLPVPLKDNRSDINTDFIYTDVLGMPPEPKPHVSITGARYEAEALTRFWYGRALYEDFVQYPVPELVKKFAGHL